MYWQLWMCGFLLLFHGPLVHAVSLAIEAEKVTRETLCGGVGHREEGWVYTNLRKRVHAKLRCFGN